MNSLSLARGYVDWMVRHSAAIVTRPKLDQFRFGYYGLWMG